MRKVHLLAVFGVAAWSAIVFGLLGGAGLLALSYYEPPLSWISLIGVSAPILWIEPAFNLLLFLFLACALALVLLAAPRLPRDMAAFAVFSALGFLELALFSGRLHRVAAVILAVGLACAVCRWLFPRRERAMRFVLRGLPVLFAVWLAVAAATTFGAHWIERNELARLPSTAKQLNVLLIVADTLRADRTSLHGYARPTTPFLERLASESTIFTQAIANSSWTLPAHASLFTGLYPYEHAANGEALAEKHVTLAEVFRDRGYTTAAFVANTSLVHRRTGLAQGFIRYEDYYSSPLDMAKRTVFGRRLLPRVAHWLGYYDILGRKRASDVNASFLRWLDARGERPFFVFLNYFSTHDPYMPPLEFAARFSSTPEKIVRRKPVPMDMLEPAKAQAAEQVLESDAYDAAVAYLDSELEKLFAELQRRGQLDKTLVVLTSDHGESIFEHGRFGHSSTLYREQIHVPLLFRLPGHVPAGLQDPRAVDLTSVPATVLALASLSGSFPGQNLFPFSAQGNTGSEAKAAFSDLDRFLWRFTDKPSGNIWMRSLVTPQWHFIRNAGGEVELYDWQSDPAERHNLAGTEQGEAVVQKFLSELNHHPSNSQVARLPR